MTNNEEFCGKVPLHQTNLIQPHGFLLITDASLKLLQVSENVNEVFALETNDMVGRPLYSFLQKEHHELLLKLIEEYNGLPVTVQLSFPGGEYEGELRKTGDLILLELEKVRSDRNDNLSALQQMVSRVMSELEKVNSVQECCEKIATLIRSCSGFDKVMVYRFDEQWNGEVLAEEKEDDMETYMGHKFPASDIPPQARALYTSTVYRLIPTTEYVPVPLYPVLNPATGKFTDLSTSNLRSVAGVHLEYLRNMKITASMSTRILYHGKLWGLIACHHKTPKYLSVSEKAFFSIVSGYISSRIAHLIDLESLHTTETSMSHLEELMSGVYSHGELPHHSQGILLALSASGASVLVNGKVMRSYGSTPPSNDLEEILLWVQAKGKDGDFSIPSVKHILSTNFSGLLVLPFNLQKGDVIFAYRPEVSRNVLWGGNPADALVLENGGKHYHPRTSFNTWKESVKDTAIDWTADELHAAGKTRDALRPFI